MIFDSLCQATLLLIQLFSQDHVVPKVTVGRSKATEASLTAKALEARNTNDESFRRFWEAEEAQRVSRLVKASRELGFELPHHCYR